MKSRKEAGHLNFFMLTAGLHTFLLLLNLFKSSLAWVSGDKPLPRSSANFRQQYVSQISSSKYVASPDSSAHIIWRLSWGVWGNKSWKSLFTLSADSLLPGEGQLLLHSLKALASAATLWWSSGAFCPSSRHSVRRISSSQDSGSLYNKSIWVRILCSYLVAKGKYI